MNRLYSTIFSTVVAFAKATFAQQPTESTVATPWPENLVRGGMCLTNQWDMPMPTGRVAMKELHDLIGSAAPPNPNPDFDLHIPIFKGVTYLMPLAKAKETLGLSSVYTPKTQLLAPGFPYRSLFINTFTIKNLEDDFNKMYLVTDAKDKVVALQLANENKPAEGRFTKKEWITWDFVNARTKALSTVTITHSVDHPYNDLIVVTSGFAGAGSQKKSRLFLPRPLAQLCTHYINKVIEQRDSPKQ